MKVNLPPLTPAAPKGIRFGTRLFTEPSRFPTPLLVPVPGLYTILASDFSCSPRPFKALYIGESTDLKQRVSEQHEKYQSWLYYAGNRAIYVAYHIMFGTDQQRRDAECELINLYNPPCNVRVNQFPGLKSLTGR